MKTVDFKSLLMGLLLGICMFLIMGKADQSNSQFGRYQAFSSGKITFLLDTSNGQLWYMPDQKAKKWATQIPEKGFEAAKWYNE